LSNSSKNDIQEDRQIKIEEKINEIDKKIDTLLEMMSNE
jgi:hypothetical protein